MIGGGFCRRTCDLCGVQPAPAVAEATTQAPADAVESVGEAPSVEVGVGARAPTPACSSFTGQHS